MVPLYMIERLADQIGRDDPKVLRLVENAKLFPEYRDDVLQLLQVMYRQKFSTLGKEPVFATPTDLPSEGRMLGRLLVGDTIRYPYRHPNTELSGNTGVFGVTGSGKSSITGHMIEGWMEEDIRVFILDVADEYGWLIHRFPVEKLLVIRARAFPLGLFVNPVGSILSPLAWLARVVGVLRECLFLRDGSCNLLLKIVGEMYRVNGVLGGSNDYPLFTEVFQKLVTSKFSSQSRHAGFLETLVNRFHGLLQSFPALNARHSLIPEQVMQRALIIRMADLSPSEIDVFTGLFLNWFMAVREGRI